MPSGCRGNGQINYLLLLLVIGAGVAIGNLAADWIGAQLAAYRTEQAIADLSETAAARAGRARDIAFAQAQKAAAVLGATQESVREGRRRDREGERLFRACDEWRKAHSQLNTPTTHAEMQKHCGSYERYVEHGLLPGQR